MQISHMPTNNPVFSTEFLDTAVRLASLGASGFCIFAVISSSILLWRISTGTNEQAVRTVKFFMVMCVVMAVITAGSSYLSSSGSPKVVEAMKRDLATAVDGYYQIRHTSEIQQANLEKHRQRQKDYEKSFNDTIGAVHAGLELTAFIGKYGKQIREALTPFLNATTPHRVKEEEYVWPPKDLQLKNPVDGHSPS